MVDFDFFLAAVFVSLCGIFLINRADRIASWYSRRWFFKYWDTWWGIDENWVYSMNIIEGRFLIIIGSCFAVLFVAFNVYHVALHN